MIIEQFGTLMAGIVDFFKNGGIITYLITFIGIYGFLTALQKINYLRRIGDVDATEIMGIVLLLWNVGVLLKL